jgi:hypothetical protein
LLLRIILGGTLADAVTEVVEERAVDDIAVSTADSNAREM